MKNQLIDRLVKISSSRRALATVVTTLIILVVSVLLAGAVTYYAINVTSFHILQESLSITMLHIWVTPTGGSGAGAAQGAFEMINTGGRDLSINKITIRGQSVAWTDVFTAVGSVTSDLGYSSELTANYAYAFTSSGDTLTQGSALTQANGEITPKSGNTLIIYINDPDSITVNDIGLTVGVTVYTSQAIYYSECNVQAYTPATSTGTNGIQANGVTQDSVPMPQTPVTNGNNLISVTDGNWYDDIHWVNAPCPQYGEVIDTTDTYAGSPSWQCTLSSNGWGVDWWGGSQSEIVPGDTITFSAWIKTSAATLSADVGNPEAGGRIGIDMYSSSGMSVSYGISTPDGIGSPSDAYNTFVPFGTSTWTEVTITFTVPSIYVANQGSGAGTTFTPVRCVPWVQVWSDTQGSNEHGTAWFADPQLFITT